MKGRNVIEEVRGGLDRNEKCDRRSDGRDG